VQLHSWIAFAVFFQWLAIPFYGCVYLLRTCVYFFPLQNSEEAEDASKWNSFVESIKSKLTVKQVVDGVRAGGSLSFDYLLLIVTAE